MLIFLKYQRYCFAMDIVTAVIIDIVGSRQLADRAVAQDVVRRAFATADAQIAPLAPLWSTAGDEFQALYASPETAAAATTIVRLALTEDVDVRFGMGIGQSRTVESRPGEAPILDGSAWWNARAAIDEAERRGSKSATARSWIKDDRGDVVAFTPSLLLRDHIITTMRPRERRIALGLIDGGYQATIAEAEGVSQSAVSQSARRSGANAVVAAVSQWREALA